MPVFRPKTRISRSSWTRFGPQASAKFFSDQGVSGSLASRPALDEALAVLAPGDVLVTWKLDRLGRSLFHLLKVTQDLSARGIGFRSLSEAIDMTSTTGRLLLHILGAPAEFERALISERMLDT